MICKLHVDHFIAFHMSQPNHYAGSEHIKDHFCCRTRFHPCTSGNKLRTRLNFHTDIAVGSHRTMFITDYGTGCDAIDSALAQSANYIGSAAGGRNTHHNITRTNIVFL